MNNKSLKKSRFAQEPVKRVREQKPLCRANRLKTERACRVPSRDTPE